MPRRNGSNPTSGNPASAEFRKRAANLRDDALELGQAGKRLAEDTIQRAGETARDYYRQGRSRALAIETAVEENVRAHPIRSLLMAAGIGYLLARLVCRR